MSLYKNCCNAILTKTDCWGRVTSSEVLMLIFRNFYRIKSVFRGFTPWSNTLFIKKKHTSLMAFKKDA